MSTAMPQQGRTTTWELDPAHTLVEFAVKHMMFTTVKGRFTGVRGRITYDEADPTRSSVEAEIDAASIDTRVADRDTHLRSADFLDVEHETKITFHSERIVKTGENEYDITGPLTIRGQTRPVTLKTELTGQGKDPWGGQRMGFSATTTIRRGEYGLKWNAALEAGGVLVGEEVKILIETEAVLKG